MEPFPAALAQRYRNLTSRQRRRLGVAITVGVVLGGVTLVHRHLQDQQRQRVRQAAMTAPITTVTALGRLEPEGEVISVAPPAGAMAGAQVRIKRLLVDEGDTVRPGQLLAEMDSLNRLNRGVDEAAAQVAIAQTQLQVAAATQRTELQSQRARLLRAQANLRTAAAEERRYRDLYRSGAASASLYESRSLSLETARAEVDEARSRLQRLEARVSTPDGAISLDEARAQRELQAARSHLLRTRAERDDALVRAPIGGRVLSVLARPGEVPGAGGILELGRTDRMQLVAEVYQSDRSRLHLGQPVRITSTGLTAPLQGTVSRIGAIVRRQSLINTDPSANTDTRVIEVRARLDPASSARAADLSNLQVTAVFGR
ncbi:MAG: HlyD family efflux transporter periplasmic adaptor subunit [Cyanobacteria bacterium REEB417]|nr:HlyD family efflux transporter periplasmic adaptor subunit [Cyanobacteria bacterium REEB417]